MNKVDKYKLRRALLQYRNTPTNGDGLSPAQKLFGHAIPDNRQIHRKAFATAHQQKFKSDQLKARIDVRNQKSYGQSIKGRDMLSLRQPVAVYNNVSKRYDILAVVVQTIQERRYRVKTSAGTILTRNRRFLRSRPQNLGKMEKSNNIDKSYNKVPELRKSTRPRNKRNHLVDDENRKSAIREQTMNSSQTSNELES